MGASFFFLGKGGVGKSTCSALTAVGLARRGLDVLLVSMDPAHNQCDIFGTALSDRPKRVTSGLRVVEVDQDRWIRRYLAGIEERIRESYRYLTSFNLEGYFRILKHSPGLEEHALLLAYRSILERHRNADALVFDMAPTALSLRFFALPSLSLVWTSHLAALRREILEKREIVTRVRFPGREVETDRIMIRLDESMGEYEELRKAFEDGSRTRITLVMNPDRLSLSESRRIAERLEETGIGIERLLVNRVTAGSKSAVERIRRELSGPELVTVPMSREPLIGIERLEAFLEREAFPLPRI